jgi:hypothetical protein
VLQWCCLHLMQLNAVGAQFSIFSSYTACSAFALPNNLPVATYVPMSTVAQHTSFACMLHIPHTQKRSKVGGGHSRVWQCCQALPTQYNGYHRRGTTQQRKKQTEQTGVA